MTSFGKRVRIKRLEKKWEQKELGLMLGKENNSVISNWENDRAKPSADDLLILAHLLGVTTDWLLKGGEEQAQLAHSETEFERKYYAVIQENSLLKDEVIRLQRKEIEWLNVAKNQ